MKRNLKKASLILFLLHAFLPLFSQQKLVHFTYSIIDTTQNQTEQARAVYQWLTHNISYDTKQYTNGIKDNTPLQTLKKRKAVCYGYSELFHEMCKILDIESYIVHGNAKGFGYVKGDHFIKSDHAWNVIRADSNWILIDATWGSGYLNYHYDLITKIKQRIIKNTGIKTKVVFHKKPDTNYFNLSPELLCKTHFPIDSKWQLKDYPISYREFLKDSADDAKFLDYRHEIAKVRYRDSSFQLFQDALNSTSFNDLNKFDIGIQYYNQALRLNITKKTLLDSTLLEALVRSQTYLDSSKAYLSEYKAIRRNYYQEKRSLQNTAKRRATLSIKRINKIPTVFNQRLSKAYEKVLKKELYLDKSSFYVINANLSVDSEIDRWHNTRKMSDSVRINEYWNKLKSDSLKAIENFDQLNQYFTRINANYKTGKYQNDSILKYLADISKCLMTIQLSIFNMDEYKIIKASNQVYDFHNLYLNELNSKYSLESIIYKDFSSFLNLFLRTERTLLSLIETYSKLAEALGEPKAFTMNVIGVNQKLHDLYALTSEVIMHTKHYNQSWKDLLNSQNELLSIFGSHEIMNLFNRLTEFYQYVEQKNTESYTRDMKKLNSIRTESKKNVSLIEATIREIL